MNSQLQKILLIPLLVLVCTCGMAQREAPKPADVKSATVTGSVFYAAGTPAKIKDTYGIWTDFNLRTKSDAEALRAQIGDALFEQIANNCNETSGWPGAISSYEERNKVRDKMLEYVCYQIAEVDDKWILKVPADENKFLPYGIRPDHDIFFMVRKTDVELKGAPSNVASSSYSSSSGISSSSSKVGGTRAKVKDSFGIWTDFDLRSKADAAQVKALLGNTLFEDVANNCNEKLNWPYGISSYEQREKVRKAMLDYVCYQIGESDDKWILRVPASENSFQPYNLRPTRDIYFVVRKTDVELNGSPINTLSTTSTTSSSSGSYSSASSNSGTPAKINATGGMYSTFKLATDANASYLKGYLGSSLFDEVAIYCEESKWPSGIKDLTARDLVRSQMNDYKAYKIAQFDGKYILRIPAAENKFMPYSMQPSHDIYFVINQTDVTVNQSSSGTTTSTSSGNSSVNSTIFKSATGNAKTDFSNVKGFEAQLNALLEGLPYNFENLKGDKIPVKEGAIMPSDEWYSKVKMEGSEKTVVRKEWLGNAQTVQAYYGEFSNKSEAMDKYHSLVSKVDKAATPCCTLVKNENDLETIVSTSYLPFDLSGKMGPGYAKMVLDISVTKSFTFDKDYKMHDSWFISLAIYKQK